MKRLADHGCTVLQVAIRRLSGCSYDSTTITRNHIVLMRMLFVMFLAFCVTWFPYAVQALIIVFGYKEILSVDTAIGVMMLAKASICTYPIIYAYMNHQVQHAVS